MSLDRSERLSLLASMAAGGTVGAHQWHEARAAAQANDQAALAGLAGDFSFLSGPGAQSFARTYREGVAPFNADLAQGQADYGVVQGFDRTAAAGVMSDTNQDISRNANLHSLQRQIQDEQRRQELLQRDQAAGQGGIRDLPQWEQQAIAQGSAAQLQDQAGKQFAAGAAAGFGQEAGLRAVGSVADVLGRALGHEGGAARPGAGLVRLNEIARGYRGPDEGSSNVFSRPQLAQGLRDVGANLQSASWDPRLMREGYAQQARDLPLHQQDYGEEALRQLGYSPLEAKGLAASWFPSGAQAAGDMQAAQEAQNFLDYGNTQGEQGAMRDYLSGISTQEDYALAKASEGSALPRSQISAVAQSIGVDPTQVARVTSGANWTEAVAGAEKALANGDTYDEYVASIGRAIDAGDLDRITAQVLLNTYKDRFALNQSINDATGG